MLTVLKNNWARIMQQKQYLVTAVLLTSLAAAAAILLTNRLQTTPDVAVLGGRAEYLEEECSVTYPEKAPARSELLMNRYDAVVKLADDGSFDIETAKGDAYRERIQAAVQAGQGALQAGNAGRAGVLNDKGITAGQETRQVGTNIIGYMMMFLLMQGILYGRMFAEDKEKHLIERIAVSPMSFGRYLAGQAVFIWALVFVPSFIMVCIAKLAGEDTGFTLAQFAFLLALCSMLSTCMALFIHSFFMTADTGNMAGSCVAVLTSVLSGTFYDLGGGSSWADRALYLMPQKNLMRFADLWERGKLNQDAVTSLIYVIIISAVFISIGMLKTRKDYVRHGKRLCKAE
ncbi:ABC transporter permease [Murimonas intestini]|uniref:ABC-2 type transport system permease protein n=1 Tax=Murimonas intestini TaxID=1337051 RepID=A0AB73SZE0_9FIRM|nr:ABC transporter permease [Murimonas intestini]MCR1842842.1 ABC transporter permease [Murimonas intestini]MCR1868193.1 ABC transporter permease [Murimonas intestini]MCR1885315.1 ABC transporter permease [Murimonas intestini]